MNFRLIGRRGRFLLGVASDDAAWRRPERSGRPLPSVDAWPLATNGSDSEYKAATPHPGSPRPAAKFFALVVAVGFVFFGQTLRQARPIDKATSRLLVHVSKAGLFSAFADNHDVEAPVSLGSIDETARQVRLVIDTRRMKVLDPHLSPAKRQQVQARMLGPDVLDAAHFPEITFESTEVEPAGPGRLLVHGRLSLHNVTRSLAVTVRTESGRYLGTSTIKQRDFGITPVTIAGGTVKVKDELQIEFDIRMRD